MNHTPLMTHFTSLAAATILAAANASAIYAADAAQPLQGAERLFALPTPFPITWSTSKVTVTSEGKRTYVAKGTDVRGRHSELVFTEAEGAFVGTLWTSPGMTWTTRGFLGGEIHFDLADNSHALPCAGAVPVRPEVEVLHEPASTSAASGVCIDSETVDVLIVYTVCALEQYAQSQVPPMNPAAALPLLKAECANVIDQINTIFDDSKISTPERTRQMRLVGLQAVDQCGDAEWAPDPVDPIYACHQLEDPQTQTPEAWCGEDIAFSADLALISDPTTAVGGIVAQLRDHLRADFVAMLRVGNPAGPAGISLRKDSNSGCNGASGFCVVDVLGISSMIHEMGHNFGCCHEPGQGGNFLCPPFPFAFGHRFSIPNGTTFPPLVGTVMCYPPGDRIPRFSNPEVLFPPGNPNAQPTGTAQAQYPYWSDNARTIRENFDDVRCYRCANIPQPPLPSGPVVCFGSDSHGQSSIPDDLLECTKVAAGHLHTVALQEDGVVRAWGAGTTMTNVSPNYGQSMVPVLLPEPPYGDGEYLGTCSGVAAGLYHSAAIRTRGASDPLDGTVACWGAGRFGQFASPHYGQSTVPTGAEAPGPCTKVSAGHYHTLALRRDGAVRAWGAGLSGLGPWPHLGQSAVSTGLGPCLDIAAGGYHSVAIQRSGQTEVGGPVVAWGAGQTNSGSYSEYGQSIVPAMLGNCTAVAAGVFHTVALKADGTVRAWGAGTTSLNVFPKYGQSIVPVNLGTCTTISAGGSYLAGGSHTLAIKATGALAGWGAGSTNSGVSPHFGQAVPPSAPLTGWVAISAGALHSAAILETAPVAPCPGDLNFDGARTGLNLAVIFSGWGTPAGDCTGDGITDGADMTLLLSGWGNCP